MTLQPLIGQACKKPKNNAEKEASLLFEMLKTGYAEVRLKPQKIDEDKWSKEYACIKINPVDKDLKSSGIFKNYNEFMADFINYVRAFTHFDYDIDYSKELQQIEIRPKR